MKNVIIGILVIVIIGMSVMWNVDIQEANNEMYEYKLEMAEFKADCDRDFNVFIARVDELEEAIYDIINGKNYEVSVSVDEGWFTYKYENGRKTTIRIL